QARLVRRGDKVLVPSAVPSLVDSAAGRTDITGRSGDAVALPDGRRLLLPNSCQHCRDPECMVDCPTGAIGRDPDGEVFINPQTCIGCEACAKRCPWDNIQIAPVPEPVGGIDQIAVKCDLCRDYDGVSACVANCPTGAIFRLDPQSESASLRAVLGLAAEGDSGARDTTAHRPWLPATLLGVATVAMSAAGIMGHLRNSLSPYEGAGLASGFVAVIAMLLLATYGLRKRAIRWVMAARRRRG